MATTEAHGVILIRNGRVYDDDGNVDLPPISDLLIVNGLIAAVRPFLVRSPTPQLSRPPREKGNREPKKR
jgi:hypothetical protein